MLGSIPSGPTKPSEKSDGIFIFRDENVFRLHPPFNLLLITFAGKNARNPYQETEIKNLYPKQDQVSGDKSEIIIIITTPKIY
ncbi:hypothetical protein B0E43_05745 [Algoriphagus sp. A40]|nr:hypothetical protein B0E43_05745 [Algoriphagus sp. A40]